jgi:hypothetical protein
MEWEYRVQIAKEDLLSAKYIKAHNYTGDDLLVESMNMEGERGWELVQVVPLNGDVTFIYKKPKPRELGKEY